MLLLLCEKESTRANEDLCIEKMKAFAEYIASAMYFAEAFFNADKYSAVSSARSECPLYKKQLTNTLQGYIVQNIRIPMRGM